MRKSAWIAFGVALTASILLVGLVLVPVWKPLFVASVLAASTYGPYRRLTARLGERRRVAAALMVVAVVVVLLLPIAAVVQVIVREAIAAVAYVQAALEEGGLDELVRRLPDTIERPVRGLVAASPLEPEALTEDIGAGGVVVARMVRDLARSFATLLFSLAIMLVAYFALLTDGHRLIGWLEEVSPLRRGQMSELLDQFRLMSRSVLRSALITGGTQAAAAGVGYAIAGIPHVVFFTILTFVASFIPSVGTAVVAVPIAVVSLLLGNVWQGVFLLAWSMAVVGLVDNVLKPILIRDRVHVNGVVIFFALVGGLLMFGAIGLLLGPLAVTFLLAMIRFGYRDFTRREPETAT